MDKFEVFREIVFTHFKLLVILAQFIFRFCRLKFLQGQASKHIVYICCVVGYLYLLKKNEKSFRDDNVFASCLFIYACSTLSLICKGYVGYATQLLHTMYLKIRANGKLRTTIYVVSLLFVAAVCSYLVTGGLVFASTTFNEHMMWRLEDNVIAVTEDRNMFEENLIHPATKGEKRPFHLSKFYRYPMEDVQMSCEFTKVWLSRAYPAEHQVVWRKNGVPVTMTDRHKHQLSFKEVNNNDTIAGAFLELIGTSNYEIKATLTIHLLRDSDFGSYTCHCGKHMNISKDDFNTNSAKLLNTDDKSRAKKHKKKQQKTTSHTKQQGEVEKKLLFKDEFLHVGEFRLIKMERRQEIIRAPASAILHLTTSYWHLSTKEDIEVDYSVNAQSFHELCQDSYFHGCSKALLLYWIFWHVEGGSFGAPPLQLFTIWKMPEFPAEQYSLVHCLCENAYGYHNMKYLRRYYNVTKKQFELVEILHPHVLAVIPREQNMLNLFKNRSQCSPVIERPVCEKPPSMCKTTWDFQTIKDFAGAVVTYFHYVEIIILSLMSLLILFSLQKAALIFEIVGQHIRRLTLDGSMGYLTTVGRMGLCSQSENNARDNQSEEKHYDVFLSYSDAPKDLDNIEKTLHLLENCGLSVCFRNRDLPPNLTELQGLSQAIENSEKFLIFLSADYCEDHFRKDYEAAMIVEALSDRRHGGIRSVLVVKMDQCEIPPWLSHLNLHDWTTKNLTLEDHHLRLLKWLEPPECRRTLRSKLDVFMTILPLLIVGLLFVFIRLGYEVAHNMLMPK